MEGKSYDVHEYIDRPNDSDIDGCCYMMKTTCCSVSVGNVAGVHHCSVCIPYNDNNNSNLLSKMQIALSIWPKFRRPITQVMEKEMENAMVGKVERVSKYSTQILSEIKKFET